MKLLQIWLSMLLLIFSNTIHACAPRPPVDAKIKYINPCVTDICIKTFVESKNKYCLATIKINGKSDWAYIYGKKCNQLKSNEIYRVKDGYCRGSKLVMPRIIYSLNYKPPSISSLKEARKELKLYLNSKKYNDQKLKN